jgi:pentapeptide MXKDX repeat protein
VRRFATIALSLSLLLGLSAAGRLLAQDEKKDTPKTDASAPKDDAKKDESKKDESKKDDTKKDDTKKDESKKDAPKAEAVAAEEPLPSIPPEVEAKLEAARRAVAEAIVAAQDAGLVETSIDPPPILDILITGRALDARQLKKALDQKDLQVGVNPEVFGAWYTGYGKAQAGSPLAAIVPQKNVRIVQPSKGLKTWYDERAKVLTSHIDAVRKAKGGEPAKKADEPKADAPKAEEKKDAPKAEEKKDAPKAEEKKDADKKDEPK